MQVIKEGIRIYNYYYHEIKTPVKIEARTKQEARAMLDNIFDRLPDDYKNSKLVGESVIIPLKGISEKTVKGVKYIWVGEDKSK
jgi:hypothetical protein